MRLLFLLIYAGFLIPTADYFMKIYEHPEKALFFGAMKNGTAVKADTFWGQIEAVILLLLLLLVSVLYIWMVNITF